MRTPNNISENSKFAYYFAYTNYFFDSLRYYSGFWPWPPDVRYDHACTVRTISKFAAYVVTYDCYFRHLGTTYCDFQALRCIAFIADAVVVII